MSFDWKKTLGAVAPTLATALGGPMAGVAVKVLAGKFLGDENASEQDVSAAITGATPEQLARLKEIDLQFKKDMAQVGVDLEKIAAADRNSARELAKAKGMLPQAILSFVFILSYSVVLIGLLTDNLTIPEGSRDVIVTIIGVLTAGVTQTLNFWLGSSKGSADKTEMIKRLS